MKILTRAEEKRKIERFFVFLLFGGAVLTVMHFSLYSLKNVNAPYHTTDALPWSCTSAEDNRGDYWDFAFTQYCSGASLRMFPPPLNPPPPLPPQFEMTCTKTSLAKLVSHVFVKRRWVTCSDRPVVEGRISQLRAELETDIHDASRSEKAALHFHLAVLFEDLAGIDGGDSAISLLHEAVDHIETSLAMLALEAIDDQSYDDTSLTRDSIAAKLEVWSSEARQLSNRP